MYRAKKVKECIIQEGGITYRISLIGVKLRFLVTDRGIGEIRDEFFAFFLHRRRIRPVSKNVSDFPRIVRLSGAEEKESEFRALYFSPRGGIMKDFPELNSPLWKKSDSWLNWFAENRSVSANWFPITKSRAEARFKGVNSYRHLRKVPPTIEALF